MLNTLRCQECGHRFRVPDDWVGHQLRCPACNQFVLAFGRSIVERREEPPPQPAERFLDRLWRRISVVG